MLCSHLETPTHSPSSLSLSQPLSLHLSLSFSLCVLQNVGNVISCVPVKSLGPWPKTPDLWSDGQVSWFVCVRAPVTLCVISRSICYKAPNMPFPSPKFSLKKRRGYPHFASQRAIVCELRVSASACMCWCIYADLRVCVLRPLPVWLLDRVSWACLWLWLSGCPSGMKACCFIGQAKLLRQGFYWSFELSQSQMELHNRVNPSGRICRFSWKAWMDQVENVPPWLIGRFYLF